jgi:hypothetical protein
MAPNDIEEIAEISRALMRDIGHVQDIHAAKVLKGVLERQMVVFKRLAALEASGAAKGNAPKKFDDLSL